MFKTTILRQAGWGKINITMDELSDNQKKKTIDMFLSVVEDWNSTETKQLIIALRGIVFKRYGIDFMNYLDDKLLEKGYWKKGMPQSVKN